MRFDRPLGKPWANRQDELEALFADAALPLVVPLVDQRETDAFIEVPGRVQVGKGGEIETAMSPLLAVGNRTLEQSAPQAAIERGPQLDGAIVCTVYTN